MGKQNMSANLILKKLDASSFEMIKAFFADVFTNEPWNDDWSDENQLKNYILDLTGQPSSLTIGFFDGDELVGLSMGSIKHWWRGTEYVIDEFCVSRNRQHEGIGTRFMAEVEKYIKGIGLVSIFLQTGRDVPAYQFYRKNGFVELEGHISFSKSLV